MLQKIQFQNIRNISKTGLLWALGFISVGITAATAAPTVHCTPAAHITQVSGQVSVKPVGKVVRVTPTPLPFALCAGDEVVTLAGMARLTANEYSATLDQHSRLRVAGKGSGLEAGKTLFEVKKQGPASGVQVTTRLSVIGVKGTTFLVSDDGSAVGVAMDSGEVTVASTQGPVRLYRERKQPAAGSAELEADYARFLREREQGVAARAAEYATWKAQMNREFVAYVENLNLAARRELMMQAAMAIERDMSAASVADIVRLRNAF